MDKYTKTPFLLFFMWMIFMILSSEQDDCNSNTFTFTNNTRFTSCNALPDLSSSLHWNFHQSNNTVDIAYRHMGIPPSSWVVWSLYPSGNSMVGAGALCLVAIANADGSVRAYTSPIEEGFLSFRVPRFSADLTGNQMTIYATIELPAGLTSFNQIWQHGDLDSNRVPLIHQMTNDHKSSFNFIDFSTGASSDTVHKVLNAVRLGILEIAIIFERLIHDAPDWYIGLLVSLVAVAVISQALHWFIVYKSKKDSGHEYPQKGNRSVNV